MKKQVFFLLVALVAMMQSAYAYDFSAVAPTGQTLYYTIVNGNSAMVTPPDYYYLWYGFAQPTGNLVIPENVTHNGTNYTVTTIDSYAFYDCSGLTSVTIPNSVTSIDSSTFSGCSGLTSVSIPNSVTTIGYSAFSGCSGLTSVTISNSVTSIGRWAFSDCSGLTSVTIPNSVTSIGEYAFFDCYGLTSVTIPNSVTSIGDYAFYNVRHIEYYGNATGSPWGAISMNGVVDGDFVYSDATKHKLNAYIGSGGAISIPSSVDTIGYKAFCFSTSLIAVTIPNSVTSIGSSAFYGCTSLTSVNIPDSVTTIGMEAFSYCTSLTSVSIPSNVTTIGGYAFNYVRHIEYYGSATGSPWGAISMNGVIEGDFVYSDATKHKLNAYIGSGGAISIPLSVDTIGDNAFYDCGGLNSVAIPNSVTSIGSSAFSGCTSLTSVSIPNSVTTIGHSAFSGCTSLTSVNIPDSVTTIQSSIFSGCTSLTSVSIPNGVTAIGSWAFSGCTSLTSVNIPNGVTAIGLWAFSGCTSLTSVNIPNSVTTIGYSAFSGCTSLTSVNIPDSVTSIGEMAFFRCSNINSITLGNNSLTVLSNDTIIGRAIIQLPYYETTNLWNGSVEIFAYEKVGSQFVTWSDGITTNQRSVTLMGNTTLTAFFTRIQCSLDVYSNNHNCGSVSGGGTYYYGDTVTVTAYPEEHCHFICWSDNSTENPRQIIITENTYLIAYFTIDTYTVNVVSSDILRGRVESSGTEFVYGEPCTVTATAYSGYTFAGWSNGATYNPYTFAVISDVELTALFITEGEEIYTISVVSANPTMGSVSGGGQALSGGTLTIRAIPNDSYRFVRWNDNDTNAVRTVTVTANATYTAYFENDPFGIADIDVTQIKIYATEGRIMVHGAEGVDVRVYDMMGRKIAYSNAAEEHDIPMPTAGIYMVKVGTLPARKVVVIR